MSIHSTNKRVHPIHFNGRPIVHGLIKTGRALLHTLLVLHDSDVKAVVPLTLCATST